MTNKLIETLRRLVMDLDAGRTQYALIGGFAASAWAEPRFTRDVGICVLTADDGEAERTVGQLRSQGYEIVSIVEHEYLGRLATVRLASPTRGGVLTDLLFASSGIEAEIVAEASQLEILPGIAMPVARAVTVWC